MGSRIDEVIGEVIGYMLLVLKSGKDISQFKSEFNAIRHGNYDDFIKLINPKEKAYSII